jgi:hypothetical protein
MVTITNVKVYDLIESVIASGNAMRITPVEYSDEEFQKGLKRMVRLVKSSKNTDVHCHDNALTGIRVSFDITYPQYWTPEFQRYHFADIVTSSSKMHRLSKMDLSLACNKYVDMNIIKIVQEKIDAYNENPNYTNFMEMISNCPLGLELFMRVSTNYKQLQTIYHQRKNHKLKEDWGEFCKMIENLPYFDELILGKE